MLCILIPSPSVEIQLCEVSPVLGWEARSLFTTGFLLMNSLFVATYRASLLVYSWGWLQHLNPLYLTPCIREPILVNFDPLREAQQSLSLTPHIIREIVQYIVPVQYWSLGNCLWDSILVSFIVQRKNYARHTKLQHHVFVFTHVATSISNNSPLSSSQECGSFYFGI